MTDRFGYCLRPTGTVLRDPGSHPKPLTNLLTLSGDKIIAFFVMEGDYPHLLFRRHWDLSAKTYSQLGECSAVIVAISMTPLPPSNYSEMLQVALIKGAQATTAIEGNTLTEDEIKRALKGEHLPASKEHQGSRSPTSSMP